jgi:hypothetical protein
MSDTYEKQFLELKEMEAQIKERRFMLEQKIASQYSYDVLSGKSKKFISENINGEKYEVQFSASQTRKVSYERLKQIQRKNGIPQEEIERIFRFKLEVDISEFNALPKQNKEILNEVIFVQVNKPTVKITLTKD